MSDSTYTSEIKSPVIQWKEGRGAQENTIKQEVYFSNKYTYNENTSEVKKIEIVVYNNANGEDPVVVGEMKNGKFTPNNNAKNVQFSTKGNNNDRSWAKLNNDMKFDLNKESKKISSSNEVKDELGVNLNNERLTEYNKTVGNENVSTDTIGEEVSDALEKNQKINSEQLEKSKMKREKYGNYCYPLEMKNTNQDRLKITVLDFKPASLDVEDGGFASERNRGEEKIRGSVILPIPNGVTDQNIVKFGDGTLNPLQVAGAKVALNALLGGLGPGANALGGIVERGLSNPGNSDAIANLLTSLTIGTNPNQLLARTRGAIFNNNLSLLFNGPTLRPFNFNFNVSPRDQPESIEVLKIIRMFKQSSAVQRTTNGLYLGTPHIFRLQFLSDGQPHKFLPRIKECALLTFSTNYMPNNAYMTYENSSMVAYNLQFAFQELDPIFNDDYDDIDLDGGEFKDGDVFAGFNRGETDPDTLTMDSFTGNDAADSGGIGF